MRRVAGLIAGILFCGAVVSYATTEETPVGRVAGKLTMKENGKPIEGGYVYLEAAWEFPAPPRDRVSETKADGSFSFKGVPTGPYYVRFSSHAHNAKKQVVNIEEGKVIPVDMVAEPIPPKLGIYASQKVFLPDEKVRIELHGFMPKEDSIKIDIYRVAFDQVAKSGDIGTVLSPLSSSREADIKKLEDASQHITTIGHKIEHLDAEGAFIDPVRIEHGEQGVYFVVCRAGELRTSTSLYVSDIALVTKNAKGQVLCYATELKSGKPVPAATISRLTKGSSEVVGQTNEKGLFEYQLPKSKDPQTVFVAQKGRSIAYVGFRDGQSNDSNVTIAGYCERPAYRPGDEINFKGFVRTATADGYAPPTSGSIQVKVTDPDDNVIETKTLPVNRHGAFYGKFSTSKEAAPGSYQIKCSSLGSNGQIYANVVAYRKPEFSIDITPDSDHYTMGEKGSATVECQYYYGGPVVGAKVKASIYRSPVWSYEDEDGERYTYSSRAGDYSEEVEAVTDETGRAKIQFPTRADDDPDNFSNDYEYQIHASVTEDDAKYFDGEGTVRVVRGDHNLSVEVANPLVAVGDNLDILVKTTDPMDKDKPVANQTVSVEVGHETWTRRNSVFIPHQTKTVVTGADGTAHLLVPVSKAESVAIHAASQDKAGRLIVAESWAYVEGSPIEGDDMDRIEITLDKKKYTAGDTAKALIATKLVGGEALVTMEAEGIISKRVVPITSTSTLVKLPIEKEFAPNVYVTVAYVKDKKFVEAYKRIDIDRQDRKMKVDVKTDKAIYKPGETATVTVKTVDSDGKPCPADVSVGVVDEGIYDIAEDETDLMTDFYPARSQMVVTSYSFPEIYLDGGDKGSSKIPLRKTFRDTAQWNPSVWTGDKGEAVVKVKLPDNLTQWRVTAVGISDGTVVGMNTEKFQARKDLMVRLQLPQYMVSGDHQRMTMVIANDTGKDQDVRIATSIRGSTLDKKPVQTIHVPNGKPQTIDCEVTAGEAGLSTVTARVWIDGGPNDGVEQSFTIAPHGRMVIVGKSGDGAGTFELPVRPTTDAKYGDLTISLSPTLAGDLLASLDDLIGFPYGCVEQTMSRFMPSVVVDKVVRDLGLPRPKKLEDLPKITMDSLTRLERMQHSDGGFGWWEYDDSDPFMTALVLDGVDRAKQAGQDVSRFRPKRAIEWGMKWLKEGKPKNPEDKSWMRSRYYLIYALMQYGETDAKKYLEAADLKKLSSAGLATIAQAYAAAGQSANANAALDLLVQKADGTDEAYWSAEEGAWGEEVSSVALVAFTAVRPSDPIVPKIVRHLQRSKQGNMWFSTRDTAYSLIGLSAYLSQTKELVGESTVEVLVNNHSIRTVQLDSRQTSNPNWVVVVPRASLGKGDVSVELKTSGAGRCYYTAKLLTLDTAASLPAESTDSGVTLDRKYYALEPRRLANGTMKLMPSASPVDRFKSGDLIRVELTINVTSARRFVLIEEPVPSSCHIQEREDIGADEEWSFWWSKTVIRDDRISFFTTDLERGTHKVSYTLRAEQAGQVRVLPTTLGNMYDPTKSVSTGENKIEVTR